MKILMLTPYLPYPLTSGGQIRSYNLLKNLVGRHEITLFSFIRDQAESQFLAQLGFLSSKIRLFKRRRAWSALNVFLSGITPMPFLLSLYFSPAFRRAVAEELNREKYDLIHCECFYLMHNLPRLTTPLILVEQTIEYLVYQDVAENSRLWPVKPLLYLDVGKIKLWEKRFWRQADRLVTMSIEDRDFIKQTMPDKAIDVIANGVDLGFFDEVSRRPSPEPTVLFVGQFRWYPNIDAAQYLVKEIWPIIKKQVPKAKLWIVGRNPTNSIKVLAKDSEIKVSEVEDIRRVLNQAWVLLAPIRIGRGTKYKVLEAMASGLPVVTTSLGVQGIDAKNGSEALIAKDPKGLAAATVKILTMPNLGKKIAGEAKKLVAQRYNWQIVGEELNRVYEEVGNLVRI